MQAATAAGICVYWVTWQMGLGGGGGGGCLRWQFEGTAVTCVALRRARRVERSVLGTC